MQRFSHAISAIIAKDSRYAYDAYFFLKEALDHTVKSVVESEQSHRHVSGPELLGGFKELALKEYGPMAISLLDEWGIRESRDVGEMVFNLIGEKVFGRQEEDNPEDFDEVFDFKKEFSTPFLPPSKQ